MNVVNKLIWGLMNPFVIGIVALAGGLILACLKKRHFSLVVLSLSLLWGWVWGSDFCFKYARFSWEVSCGYPQCVEEIETADAIVVLGGGVGGDLKKSLYPDMHASADREWHAARLWSAGKAPVVVPTGYMSEQYSVPLLRDLGVAERAIIAENKALNTEENAKLVAGLGYKKILLVTSAWHMKRSVLTFEKYAPKLEIVPAAIDYENLIDSSRELTWRDFVPSVEAYHCNSQFFHEVLGYCGYKWFRK